MTQADRREFLRKLAGGVALIQVGGATEMEMQEKKDRIAQPSQEKNVTTEIT